MCSVQSAECILLCPLYSNLHKYKQHVLQSSSLHILAHD